MARSFDLKPEPFRLNNLFDYYIYFYSHARRRHPPCIFGYVKLIILKRIINFKVNNKKKFIEFIIDGIETILTTHQTYR
jgi:hypothetical protein